MGNASDAHVASGEHDGFRVTRPCGNDDEIALKGTGTHKLATQDEMNDWSRSRLVPLVSEYESTSVHAVSGFGVGCVDPRGTAVWLDDWHKVDGLVDQIGGFMRDDDVDVETTIRVGPRAVAQAD